MTTKKSNPPVSESTGVSRGRPSSYTRGMADKICARLEEGHTITEIASTEGFPSRPTISRWDDHDIDGFRDRYARARQTGYAKLADELLEIADDGTNDWVTRQLKDGGSETVIDHEHVTRSRLRVDTRKWILSKVLPKIYGDKLDNTHQVLDAAGNPVDVLAASMVKLDAESLRSLIEIYRKAGLKLPGE